jgi:hypothetical protein
VRTVVALREGLIAGPPSHERCSVGSRTAIELPAVSENARDNVPSVPAGHRSRSVDDPQPLKPVWSRIAFVALGRGGTYVVAEGCVSLGPGAVVALPV